MGARAGVGSPGEWGSLEGEGFSSRIFERLRQVSLLKNSLSRVSGERISRERGRSRRVDVRRE